MRRINKYLLVVLTTVLSFTSCKEHKENMTTNEKSVQGFETNLNEKDFETVIDGKPVKLYWLKNKDLTLAITNYGGRIVGLWLPDKNGKMTDVIIGRSSTDAYIKGPESYFGATIGRVGNRIAKGKFSLNGKEYTTQPNNNENALHGGEHGFQDKVWDAKQPNEHTIILRYLSPDMEEGFPGNLNARVTYSLANDNTLIMTYEATTDSPTVVNLTNHSYFNLNGEGSGTILNHQLQLFANQFTPVDKGLIPTGELRNVENTPFNFLTSHTIGERIDVDNEQLKFGGGYDHNYVLNDKKANGMNHAATVVGDQSGIVMNVYTEEPGVQFYSGNFMASENKLKSSDKDDFRTAFCLETQHFPDAPNQPSFPSVALNPNEIYQTISKYKFSVQ